MSIKPVQSEIERFLSSSEPEVICIKGKWGVGKTFAWNHFLRVAQQGSKIALRKYSYVSLFGVNSLDDLKHSIFENTIGVEHIASGPNFESIQINLNWLKKHYRKISSVLNGSTFLSQYLGGSAKALFFVVRNQIVCIDDLERSGEGLRTRDVLGMVSFLKEQRGCKVVLLLNDEELTTENKEEFEKQLEKVADAVLEFSPSPQEAADIVFPSPEETSKLVRDNCNLLGITNIRVIKKIEKICRRLENVLKEDYPETIYQAVHTATLFGWIVYQPGKAPDIKYVKEYNQVLTSLRSQRENAEIPEVHQEWQTLLNTYNFFSTDEFDLTILEGIELGYFEEEKIRKVAKKLKDEISKREQEQSFSAAWDALHDNFTEDEDSVMTKIIEAATANVKVISPLNLDGTISLLKEFGRANEAQELLEHYVKERGDEKELFDTSRTMLHGRIENQEVVDAFKEKAATFEDSRDPGQVLDDISTKHGWNPEDIQLLVKLTEDDFYKLIKESSGVRMHRIIRSSLQFGQFQDASDDMKHITETAKAALLRIAGESKINARRVAAQGIQIEEPKEDGVEEA